jgi:cation:H+ antiporter
MAGLLTDDPLDANRALVYKEAQFYLLAVSVMVITFALAVIYNPTGNGELLKGTVTDSLALVPIVLYGLYIFIQWQDVADHEAETASGVNASKQWLLLIGGLLLILVAVELLVGAVSELATEFGVNQFLAGVTILAAVTSLPDALVSIRAARSGKSVTSIGNVLGSNTFDLLVAIPAGVLIATDAVVINFTVAVPMLGVLTVATIFLFVTMRTDLELTTPESVGLLLSYLLFVAWVVAESAGVTGVLPTT